MHSVCRLLAIAGVAASMLASALPAGATNEQPDSPLHWSNKHPINVQVGPRPYYLIDKLERGPLRRKLEQCENREIRKTNFSIAHRGAPLQFPEHTEEGYRAAARMGAGIIECDVTFTKDGELVCRHSQCDLHTTTNILKTDLAGTCEQGFQPAEFDADGNLTMPASAKCCTSGLTLSEFKSLKGKMDGADRSATTVEEYMAGTADFRTDLYSTGGTLLSHKESIKLFKQLGVSMTPELKGVDSAVGFGASGFTQKTYATRMIRDYIDAGVSPKKVWPQSFDINDIYFWVKKFPDFGKRAVFLDGDGTATTGTYPPSVADFRALRKKGVKVVAPSIPYLLALDAENNIIASDYATNARKARMKVISWSMERSGRIVEDVIEGSPGYYSTIVDGLKNDGDIIRTIDVLARDAKIIGLFSDWPGTVSYYASCMGMK